jgi:hypothetical protein
MESQNPQTNPTPPEYAPPAPAPTPPVNPQPPSTQQYVAPPQPQPQQPMQYYERPREAGVHPMVVLQPGEQIVAEIKRHPIGIVSLYAAALIGITTAAILVFVLLPNFLSQFSADNSTILYGGLGIVVVLILLVLGVATSVYWQNQWVVTTDSITQITQGSLFDRQVAQLSMDNLEDVTVNQDGIMMHLFNYGILKVETAGERSKFVFAYCPHPTDYARRILEVHEQFLEERRNVQSRP